MCGAQRPRSFTFCCSSAISTTAASSSREIAASFGYTYSSMNARVDATRSAGGAKSATVTGLASHEVRLGFYMGYAPPGTNPLELIELAQLAERLGYESAWAAEAWGTDAVTVLAWLAAKTMTLKIGSAIMQIPGRSPANTAMTAATLDLLSGGRFQLGLGTSGPQAAAGWHGQPRGQPLE